MLKNEKKKDGPMHVTKERVISMRVDETVVTKLDALVVEARRQHLGYRATRADVLRSILLERLLQASS
jgi:hypothetical protein